MDEQEIKSYGTIARLLHWSVALLCIVLFLMGLWMVGLDNDHGWFFTAPFFHKLLGTLLFFLIIIKMIWTLLTPPPAPLESHSSVEKKTAYVAHLLINSLLFLICISGNVMLMSVADKYSVHEAVNLAEATGISNLRELAHLAHYLMACSLAGLVLIHLFAVIKHTVFDRDRTLKRMFGK